MVISGTLAIKHILKQIDSIGFHGEVRLDANVSPAARKFFDDIPVYERKSAEVVNMEVSQWYSKPPFMENTKVALFKVETNMQDKFVRMYTHNSVKPVSGGQFIALYGDVIDAKGNLLSAATLKDKFDLLDTPTHYSRVNAPIGTELAVGIVKSGNFGGKGGGTQFYFTQRSYDDWFINSKAIK